MNATDHVAQAASRMRIAVLGVKLVTAIGTVLDEHPDLTWEETLAALNDQSTRVIGHLLTEDDHD